MQVEDAGKSEGPAVMAGIRVLTLPYPKGEPTSEAGLTGAQNKCEELIPEIIKAAIDELVGLARYKGMSGVSADRRKLFGLPTEES